MSKQYYECHVTILCLEGDDYTATRQKKLLRDAIEQSKWKFSQIEGDIALGDGVKCYATTHYNARTPVEDVLANLHYVGNKLEGLGYKVIRRKVELVIYDDRSTKVQPGTCEGACVGCHLDDYEHLNKG